MNLTRDDWVRLVFPLVGTAVLTLFGHFLIWEWRQPDVRYGTGSAYMSPNLAVSSVTLKNVGHSDAKNIIITTSFADPLVDFSTGKMATRFNLSAGGKGQKFVTGTIERLVPDETTYIYFITEPSSPWVDHGSFIRGITFDGGQGKTGIPWLHSILAYLIAGALAGIILVPFYYFTQWQRRKFQGQLRETIQLGLFARQEGLTQEQLHAMVEERYPKVRWYIGKQPMITAAQAAYEGGKQTPI
jgi:hypothetical protein